jgi:uncharacterized membrane protein
MAQESTEQIAALSEYNFSASNDPVCSVDTSKEQTGQALVPAISPIVLAADFKPDQELKLAYEERRQVETRYQDLRARRSTLLGVGLPYLIFGLVLLAGYEARIYRFIFQDSELHIQSPPVRILLLWLLAIAITGSFFFFYVQSALNQVNAHLKQLDETIEIKRLLTMMGRFSYYREKLSKLTAKTAKVFFFDPERYEKAESLRAKAVDALDAVTNNVTAAGLSDVETYLTALEEIINRQEGERTEQRYWQNAALVVMCLYITGLVTSVIILRGEQASTLTPIFNVPLAVVIWGAAGSLAAILYRFYTEQGRIRFAFEFRWLIARPIIGIIMGAVVYLALVSGLVLLGATNGSGETSQVARIEVYSVIAFLAGFSDKFYLGVIDLLVARTIRTEEVSPNIIVTEKQRVPEVSKTESIGDSQTVTENNVPATPTRSNQPG